MQQIIPLNSLLFYVLIFSSTVFFYTLAYLGELDEKKNNPRIAWYAHNRKNILVSQYILLAAMLVCSAFYAFKYYTDILVIPLWQWVTALSIGITAILYYGIPVKKYRHINLRRTGWMKPFVIGFVWAGLVNFIPIIFYEIEQHISYNFSMINLWLFIKNCMYISVLAIMFDIKDYAADHNQRIKTFVVIHGLRSTIFYIIIPLTIAGFISFFRFTTAMHFNETRIFFNSIPFVLLLATAWSMRKRKSILYYLVVIDGLMLLKAICGITGMML